MFEFKRSALNAIRSLFGTYFRRNMDVFNARRVDTIVSGRRSRPGHFYLLCELYMLRGVIVKRTKHICQIKCHILVFVGTVGPIYYFSPVLEDGRNACQISGTVDWALGLGLSLPESGLRLGQI